MNTASSRRAQFQHLRRGALHVLATLGCVALLAGPAHALAPGEFRSDARSIETSSNMVSLPSPGGTVVVARGCESCEAVTLSLTPATVFRIGKRNVAYADFRSAALKAPKLMSVHYHRTTLAVLKIRLDSND